MYSKPIISRTLFNICFVLGVLGVIAAFASISGCGAPANTLCNQRLQIRFAADISSSKVIKCNTHDYDDDEWPAAYDEDDRWNKHADWPDGRGAGMIRECLSQNVVDAHYDRFESSRDFDWGCIRDWWGVRLDELCATFADGTMEVEYYEEEEASFYEYCDAADIAVYEGVDTGG